MIGSASVADAVAMDRSPSHEVWNGGITTRKLHRRQDRWQPQVHETLLAATPSLLPISDSSSCRRSTICTSRSSAIDPVQPLTAYAGTINKETDWTATSCSFHSPVTFSSRSVWTRSLRGSPMLTPSALVVNSSRTRVTPAQRVHQHQLLLHHLQQLFELQEPEAGFMLAVGLDFGKQSRSQLRLPLAQPPGFVTSGHNASDATARQSSRANA